MASVLEENIDVNLLRPAFPQHFRPDRNALVLQLVFSSTVVVCEMPPRLLGLWASGCFR